MNRELIDNLLKLFTEDNIKIVENAINLSLTSEDIENIKEMNINKKTLILDIRGVEDKIKIMVQGDIISIEKIVIKNIKVNTHIVVDFSEIAVLFKFQHFCDFIEHCEEVSINGEVRLAARLHKIIQSLDIKWSRVFYKIVQDDFVADMIFNYCDFTFNEIGLKERKEKRATENWTNEVLPNMSKKDYRFLTADKKVINVIRQKKAEVIFLKRKILILNQGL
jgi:ubiquinone biosynthesis protein UbiJ